MTLTKLREIAMAATPGQWDNDSYTQISAQNEVIFSLECKGDRWRFYNNLAHVTQFSPAMVLKLLEVVDCALELQEIFAPDYNGEYDSDYVDSFTMQPMNRALAALKETSHE